MHAHTHTCLYKIYIGATMRHLELIFVCIKYTSRDTSTLSRFQQNEIFQKNHIIILIEGPHSYMITIMF
jgi:hypothetical protein